MKVTNGKWVIACVIHGIALLLLISSNCYSQSGTSAISGRVVDPQGKVIAGASVLLRDTGKNFSRTKVTDDTGTFSFALIPPGSYSIEVEAAGFKKAVINNVPARVDIATEVDPQLEVGSISEVVNVSAGEGEVVINTQDASLGNNFVSKQILQLPLNARNVGVLLSLQPGVSPDGSATGSRRDQGNLTLDGVDVNEQQTGQTFAPVLRVNPDSVEEFRVTTTNPNANQGRSSGAQVSFVTRSGTNDFRGALYWYHRNTVTSANEFFNNAAGNFGPNDNLVLTGQAKAGDPRVPRPKLLRNLFGGRLGGPIVKKRLFFFYNYEGLREAKETTVVRAVPLPGLGQGSVRFRNSGGNLITLTTAQINALTSNGLPVVDVNPIAAGILAGAASRYPANDTAIGDRLNTGGFRFNAGAPVQQNAHTARFDWNVTEDGRHLTTIRGNYLQDNSANASQFPDTPQPTTWNHPIGLLARHTWAINSDLVNNFSFGFTRDAFSTQGDSSANSIVFAGVFNPALFSRTLDRKTPVMNITDDFTWTKGNHTFQFGGNIRIVRNQRTSFSSAFDSGNTGPGGFAGAGASLTAPITQAGYTIGAELPLQRALASVLGRMSTYSANFNFGIDSQPLPSGTGVFREFATEEYDVYFQDNWKLRQTITLNLGLRYGLSRSVYEKNGFQTRPAVGLQAYLQRRIAAAAQGQNYGNGADPSELLQVELAGPFHGKRGFYDWDKNNFQPRVSVAWSPNFRRGFLSKIFGADQTSVLRGGFAITNDYFGQALAVNFDAENTLGFSSSQQIAAETYNVSTNPGPLITGLGMVIRSLPGISVPGSISFPRTQPADYQRRIEGSLDSNLVSPINYSWNMTFERKLPAGLNVQASYIGRLARNLLASRDVMALNNIRDPVSGQDWYTAANILENFRVARTPISSIPNLPFFENMYSAGYVAAAVGAFNGVNLTSAGLTNTQAAYVMMAYPNAGGCAALPGGKCFEFDTDWTNLQNALDSGGRQLFYQGQYGALSAFGTIGSSDYHGGSLSIRQRRKGLSWDFNYTLSKSIDDASGLQSSAVFGAAFILNPLRQRDNRAVSDFDVRHIVNFNSIWEVPIGKGQMLWRNAPGWANTLIGGWQLATIARYNTGYPAAAFFDTAGWPTSWTIRSNAVRAIPLTASPTSSVQGSTSNFNGSPNLFSDPVAAYRSFRSPRPGETGERNVLRMPSFFVLDVGLTKSFNVPGKEGHKIQVRWEVFNATNTPSFTGIPALNREIGLDPFSNNGTPPAGFGKFTATQTGARVMQFALRYDF